MVQPGITIAPLDIGYQLTINPLCIQLTPKKDGDSSSLAEHNPLREYYLDLNNLKEVGETEVNQLFTRFWERFISNDKRRGALVELELQDPVDWLTIKKQHRRLAMQHHPDRGGNEERLQAINAAMGALAKNSRHSRNKKT